MLALTRKFAEELVFTLPDGGRITLKVLQIVGGDRSRVRLGIEAPGSVVIARAELLDRKEVPGETPPT